ncbi:MAG: hypothetical protein IKO82_01710 [Prevotella sp.]|nr:hypothetical protein [Prevotella sp.]
MKKKYICPTIEFELMENEEVMINLSATHLTQYTQDPSKQEDGPSIFETPEDPEEEWNDDDLW